MWLVKLKLKHNCTVGNRIQKFNLMDHITYISSFKEKNINYAIGMHRLIGEEKNIKNFIRDFRKDKDVVKIEVYKDIIIAIEKTKELPIGKFKPKLFFQKPVFIDRQGYEYWEFFSFDRNIINKFITEMETFCDFFEIKQLKQVNLTDIYFPHAIPQLTDKQKRAFELALERGYYSIPRKTDIRKLAQIMKISKSTYNDLLRRAEGKILPDLINMHLIE